MHASDWETELVWMGGVGERFTGMLIGVPHIGRYLPQLPYVGQAIAASTERVFGQRTYPGVIYTAPNRVELARRLISDSDAAFARGACNCMPSLAQGLARGAESDFAGVKQATRILWEIGDRSHASSDREGLCHYVDAAQIELIEEAGHHLELENPRAVCELIRSFLAETA